MFIPKKSLFIVLLLMTIQSGPALAEALTALDLIRAMGCMGCHSLNGNGGTFGPSLDGIGNRLSEDLIRQQLLDPRQSNPASRMPASTHLSELELNLIVDYLGHLRQ